MPRSGDTEIGADEAAGAACGVEAGVEVGGALSVALALGAAASTSSLRIRPPIPVPLTFERSTPFSDANLRTIGVTYASSLLT